MTQTYKCKEAQCTEHVEYEPQAVPGSIGGSSFQLQKRSRTAYLTCPLGHVHPYVLDPHAQSPAGGMGTSP